MQFIFQDRIASFSLPRRLNTLLKSTTFCFVVFFVFSCSSGGSDGDDAPVIPGPETPDTGGNGGSSQANRSPVVSLSPTQAEEGESTTISGTILDPDGDALTYLWTWVSGPTVTLENNSQSTAQFTTPEYEPSNNQLVLRLTVTDANSAQSSATVTVSITEKNNIPTVEAGKNQAYSQNRLVSLNATATDNDGTIASYAWRQLSGPSVELSNANTQTASFTTPTVSNSTTLVFEVTVTDDRGASKNDTINVLVTDYILATIADIDYQGAFKIPSRFKGEGRSDEINFNYANGAIAYNADNNTLFIAGKSDQYSIAEFGIPTPVISDTLADLNTADSPLQYATQIWDRLPNGNPELVDYITGFGFHDGKLIINATEYYDAGADTFDTTLVVGDTNNLVESTISDFYSVDGAAHVGGWISEVPENWQSVFAASHIMGFASNIPINVRHSMGPTAFLVNIEDIVDNAPGQVSSEALLDFSLQNKLHDDPLNETRSNDLWTETSEAVFGFIIPGTHTYAVFGSSSGHESGVGYKAEQDIGGSCAGHCAYVATDAYNYYWLWDLNDLMAVRNGEIPSYSPRPYEYGVLDTPFKRVPSTLPTGQRSMNLLGGGTFDKSSMTMYLTLKTAGQEGEYDRDPLILAYKLRVQ